MSVFAGIQLPKIIYETESKYNGKIEVYEYKNSRKLKVGGIYQSLSADSVNAQNLVWGKVVKVLKENEPKLNSVLILGLGGGTMQHLVSKEFPGSKIVSVEIDPEMVGIAAKFFDVDKIPNHTVITDDACRVIVEPEMFNLHSGEFNAIIVDIYCGQKYPDLGKSGNFIAGLKRMVNPGGLIIFNRIYTEEHQHDVNIFIDTVGTFLSDVSCLIVAGHTNSDNVIVYGRA